MHKTDTLAQRLRAFADELESAERFGIPLPGSVNVSAHYLSGVSIHFSDPEQFKAWAEYAEAAANQYEHDGRIWQTVDSADFNGLRVSFATVVGETTPNVPRLVQA